MQHPDASAGKENINILVCLSASPSNRKVLRSAARFAGSNQRPFTALYVDTGRIASDNVYLQNNMQLARSLGASVEIVSHRDILGAVMEYARNMAVTDLFIGYSGPERGGFTRHLPAYRLVHSLPEVDIHIIPDATIQLKPSDLKSSGSHRLNMKDFFSMTAVMAIATGLSVIVDHSPFSNSNIVTIYILAVLITAVITAERLYSIIAAILYILLFNFLFIDPRFSFLVYDPKYMVTYLVSLIAAVITGNISSKMKQISLQERMNAYQAQILLNASELLQQAKSSDEIIEVTISQLKELLGRDILFYPAGDSDAFDESKASDPDAKALCRTFTHNQKSGRSTRYYPEAENQYLAIRSETASYGVIAVVLQDNDLNRFEENILLSMINECALSLENEKNRREREAAQIIAENEQFRSKLLRSISHDLRTPLTSISGNAANLLSHADEIPADEKGLIYSDIYEDSVWLTDLVENLLAITRLEESVAIHPSGEIVSDILSTAIANAGRHKSGHKILFEPDQEYLIAVMDAPLILQVLHNLIGNAVKHTPDDTTIRVSDRREGDEVLISVADDGPGIPDEEKPKIFDLFYTGTAQGPDSGRSLGLGLNLCRSIVEAHGGKITVEDNTPHGSIFTFSLQIWKGNSDESVSDTDR